MPASVAVVDRNGTRAGRAIDFVSYARTRGEYHDRENVEGMSAIRRAGEGQDAPWRRPATALRFDLAVKVLRSNDVGHQSTALITMP